VTLCHSSRARIDMFLLEYGIEALLQMFCECTGNLNT